MIMTGRLRLAEHVEVSVKKGGDVMTTLRKVADFIFFYCFFPLCTITQNLPERSTLTHLLPS